MQEFSDYIVFVDESGDHNLEKINPEYPIFVLAFCIFTKESYMRLCSDVQKFKFKWLGCDSIILHERDIVKPQGPFTLLRNPHLREGFLSDLSDIMQSADMHVITAIINKERHKQKYVNPHNPYHLSLLFCMERLSDYLLGRNQSEKATNVIFEQRGGKANGGEEDQLLELEFRRICDGEHQLNARQMPGMVFKLLPKVSNSIGLQIADLMARPIGLHWHRPAQPNRAFDIIRKKFAPNGVRAFP